MYVCTAPGLRLNSGAWAEIGKEVPEAKDWPRHMQDLHIRAGRLKYTGKPEDRHIPNPAPPRPRYTAAERERLKNLPAHMREQLAQRRGMPADWLHNPAAAEESKGGGVQLTEEQRKAAISSMPEDTVAMAAKARGVTAEELKSGKAPKAEEKPSSKKGK